MNEFTYEKKVFISYGGPDKYSIKISESLKIRTRTRSHWNPQGIMSANYRPFELVPVMNLITGVFGMNCYGNNISFFYPLGLLAIVLIIYAVIVKVTK